MDHDPPHGFPTEIIVGESDTKHLCSRCKYVLREPIQSYCGHRFCKECIKYMFSSGEATLICPACQLINQVDDDSVLREDTCFPDNAMKREFASIWSQCIYDKCTWRGSLKNYQDHEKICEHRKIKCKCGRELTPSALDHHMAEECPERLENCRFCAQDVAFKDRVKHQNECPKMPIECPVCQKKDIEREKLKAHQAPEGDCLGTLVQCQFGCEQMIEKKNLTDHNEKRSLAHLWKVAMRVLRLEQNLSIPAQNQPPTSDSAATAVTESKKISDLEKQLTEISQSVQSNRQLIESLPSNRETESVQGASASVSPSSSITSSLPAIENIERSLNVNNQKVGTFEAVIAALNHTLERCSLQVDTIDRQRKMDRELLTQLDQKNKSLERMLAVKDVAMAELEERVKHLERTSFDGVLLWKIEDFRKKRDDAISGRSGSLYSPSFYTSRTGYKMCARIYPHGDGMGKGSHVSLFFVIMRGEYDALQRWPFRQKVTMMFLDQAHKEQHVTDTFRPDPTSSSFRMPTGEMNVASGCPLFIPLSSLDDTSRAYVRNDTVFIKIVVDSAE